MKRWRLVALLSALWLGGAPRVLEAAPLDEARALTRAGMAAFEQARYAAAEQHFAEAYALAPEPALLYNLARCRAALGRDLEAADTYERFARVAPTESDRLEAETAAAEARRRAATRAPAAPRRFAYPATVGLASTSAAMLLASLGTGLAAQGRHDDLTACTPACPGDVAARADGGERLRIASIATLAIGSATLLGTAVAAGVEARRARRGR